MTIYVNHRPVDCQQELPLPEVLRAIGFNLPAPCGGLGRCGKCVVNVDGREVLACKIKVRDGMEVFLKQEAPLAVLSADTSVLPADGTQKGLGVAVDIGTTTVAAALIDRNQGKILCSVGEGNLQRAYGGDVISRITAAEEHLAEMTTMIRRQVRSMALCLCEAAGVTLDDITEITAAANTVMAHIFCGLDPKSIGVSPFTPLSLFGEALSLEEFPCPVYLLPAVSGYVGGDITADLLAVGLDRTENPILLLDVGTNGEIVLGFGDHFYCCAAAAGPAFEGDRIACGMTAASGAISAVTQSNGVLQIEVIGGGEPRGICGSGLMDAVALLLDEGILDETGRMVSPEETASPLSSQIRKKDGYPAFYLTDTVYISQEDVRSVQLGKAAIAAGIEVLLSVSGIKPQQISGLLLAGGFGSFIRPSSAARIGMFPASLLPVTETVGNSALRGAELSLLSKDAKQRLSRLRDSMDYVELSGRTDFGSAYVDAMFFPEE